jgi:hypothetical protein
MTPDVATQNQAALELKGKIDANPALAQPFLKILELVGGDVEKLASLDLSTLNDAKQSLPKAELTTEQKLRANNQIAGRAITLRNSLAIEIQVLVKGQIIRAVLSDASFNKNRTDQRAYAQKLGGRLALEKENRAVVNYLLEKEVNGTINPAETNLLKTYREQYVRDSQGSIKVDGRHVRGYAN